MSKHANDKRIVLIATMGAAPAVLTETVWELAHAYKSIIPDEIVVLSARNSVDKLRHDLLEGSDPVWAKLRAALTKDKIKVDGKLVFGPMSIHVIPDASKNEMWDLRSAEDNLLTADFMMQEIRKYSESPDVEIIASIAGGRKTMSALLLSCMSLLGRDEDKVVHVLLPEELEGGAEPPFYFPQKGVVHVRVEGNARRSCRWARSCVASIPVRGTARSKRRRGGGVLSASWQNCKARWHGRSLPSCHRAAPRCRSCL